MPSPPSTVLLVHADAAAASTAALALADSGASLKHVTETSDLKRELDQGHADVLVVDTDLPGQGGLEPLRIASERWPDVPVILIGSRASSADQIAAIRAGASDFVTEPIASEAFRRAVRKALSAVEAAAEAPPPSVLAGSAPRRATGTVMVGDSVPMRELGALVARSAASPATVLIRGESGSGKEVVARRIHEQSPRSGGPFVKVHCAALPEQLLESELFGYERGAFTGATSRKPGRVQIAEGGSLFLDEIGDISTAIQVKLLRVLQDKEYELVGGTKTLKADVRFITATHRNLEQMVKHGEFREDLYYRLNVVSVTVPPLRARPEDIPPLVDHFCALLGAQNGKPGLRVAPSAVELLQRQAWPGNVRQLQNFVERLVVFSDSDEIELSAVKAELSGLVEAASALGQASWSGPEPSLVSTVLELTEVVRLAERKALEKALRKASGNKTVAARILGVSRRTLYNKLQEHGLV